MQQPRLLAHELARVLQVVARLAQQVHYDGTAQDLPLLVGNFAKFLTGASIVGSIDIPSILNHAGVIGWGALTIELSSFGVFGLAILWFIQMNGDDEYSSAF